MVIGVLIIIAVTLILGIQLGFMLGFSKALRAAAARMQPDDRRKAAGQWCFGFGCLSLVVALGAFSYCWWFVAHAVPATGTIVEMRENVDKDHDVTRAPTFAFRDARGVEHTVESRLYSAPPGFHAGDTVPVLYRLGNPADARINSFWYVWGFPTMLLISGPLLLATGRILVNWPQLVARFKGGPSSAQADMAK